MRTASGSPGKWLGSCAPVKRHTQATARFKQAGLLTAIPFVLLVGPTIGYYLGSAVDRRWPFAPWGLGIGIAVGLLASARVTIELIQQAARFDRDE